MNTVQIAQLLGAVSIGLLFCINFFIAISEEHFQRVGRTAFLWSTIYFFFLFMLRFININHLATRDEISLLSGFSAPIPLLFVMIHLFLSKKV